MAEGEEQQEQQKRRNPAVPKKIGKVSPSTDRRVRLVGRIAKKGENGAIVLDDGSGKTDVFFDNLDIIDKMEKTYSEGDPVLVTGLVVPRDGGSFDISGEIVRRQDKPQVPEELLKKAEAMLENG